MVGHHATCGPGQSRAYAGARAAIRLPVKGGADSVEAAQAAAARQIHGGNA